jgi:hypothetical protein
MQHRRPVDWSTQFRIDFDKISSRDKALRTAAYIKYAKEVGMHVDVIKRFAREGMSVRRIQAFDASEF